MLVLSRKASQRIVIGENIELVVIAVDGNRVKLGFNAPSDIPIHREEVHQGIASEVPADRSAATTTALAIAETVLADLRQAKVG